MSDNPNETGPASEQEKADSYVGALRREGAGYAALGRDDRLADVNAELKRVGASPIEGAKRAASRGAAGRQTR